LRKMPPVRMLTLLDSATGGAFNGALDIIATGILFGVMALTGIPRTRLFGHCRLGAAPASCPALRVRVQFCWPRRVQTG